MTKTRARSEGEPAYHHGDLRRSLIDAALELLTEEQNWMFSIREVARRAGVSHNAPYNHFADKRDLLAAVAAVGFVTLRKRMLASSAGVHRADAALVRAGIVYVKFGTENPAHYRLMFGPALGVGAADRPEAVTRAAGEARAILTNIIQRGAERGVFPLLANDPKRLQVAILSAWSTVHGLTMLLIDRLAGSIPRRGVDALAEEVAQTLTWGLTRTSKSYTSNSGGGS